MPGRPPIGKPDLERLRVRFIKNDRLAYLGHLEVINTISRSVRRAKMPVSVGNGFAQRMRIQFSQALPVGAASTCEYYDLYLTERVDEGEAFELLRASTPKAMANVVKPGDTVLVTNRFKAQSFALEYKGGLEAAKATPYLKAVYSGPFSEKDQTTQAYADYGYYSICLLLDLAFGHKSEKNITTFDEYFTRMNCKDVLTSTGRLVVLSTNLKYTMFQPVAVSII